jgi:hypothetical protein
MDDIVTVTATPQELEYVRGLAERELRETNAHKAEVDEIVKLGQRKYGARFDEASETLAKALGDRTQQTMQVLRHSQTPHQHIMDLAADPQRLERFAKLPIEAQRAEISSQEKGNAPYGRVIVAADPAWKNPGKNGTELMSDADWNSGASDLLSDEDFFRNANARVEKRNKARGGRY